MKLNKLFTLLIVLLAGLLLTACGEVTQEQVDGAVQQAQELATQAGISEEDINNAVEQAQELATQAGISEEDINAAATQAAELAVAAQQTAEAVLAEAQTETETTEEEVTEELPEVYLTVWADENRAPILEGLAADFEEQYGVALIVELVGFGDIKDQLTIAGPAGEGPDIIVGAHDWLGELVSNGLLSPIDLGDKAGDFAPSAVQAFTVEGDLYGLPNATENVGFFINTDLVPSCPATWTEVQEISTELAANNTDDIESNQYGFIRMEGDPFHFFPIQTAFGGYVFGLTEEGYDASDVGIDSEGSLAAATFWDGFVKAGLQPPATDWESMHLAFESGQAAMIISGPWAVLRITDSGIPFEICPLPGEVAEAGAPFLGAQGFMISAFANDPLLAQIFLTEFVATPEVMYAFYEADPRTPAYLPVLETLEDPNVVAFGEAGANALPMPTIPEMDSVWGAWEGAIVLIAQQGDDPINAFTNAAEQIRTAIAEGQ